MINNSEMVRIRRQMQRRIRDVVAERRRARQLEAEIHGHTGDPSDTRTESSLTPTA
ncbi:hypothetical protein ABGB16_27255 [Micromonospora sp. B11E3]|uniref:hypothetical protein n=1 Tax=unclassified Micromonospora TaxID=2617518 RepID=UPI00325EB8E9